MELFGSRPRGDLHKIAEIKQWAAEVFRLSADATVLVTELHCTEPDCAPLETVIAILNGLGQPRQYKIFKPAADVTFADLTRLASATVADWLDKDTAN